MPIENVGQTFQGCTKISILVATTTWGLHLPSSMCPQTGRTDQPDNQKRKEDIPPESLLRASRPVRTAPVTVVEARKFSVILLLLYSQEGSE